MIQPLTSALHTAVTSSSGLAGASSGNVGAPAEASAAPFGGVLQSLMQQTSALDGQASQAVTGLLSGQGVDIHDAMIATEKADMAFELALQIRNKAVGAYQQMMGMQF
ncbi:MAG TPA: flagellar hook-basal body complex protein FliE [Acidobacteriaceae bacterium]